MRRIVLLLLFTACVSSTLWPLPQVLETTNTSYALVLSEFSFQAVGHSSDILEAAFGRYMTILKEGLVNSGQNTSQPQDSLPRIVSLQVEVLSSNLSLSEETVENYTLQITSPISKLQALTVYGALRGLETFSQAGEPSSSEFGQYIYNQTSIQDWPRFQYRGSLIDTSRHYLDLDLILQHLDAMAYNKLNVLHWHIVDDQSFPYVSKVYPLLSEKGSYVPGSPSHIYTPDQVQQVITYARNRGIRVIPEFDSPGHTLSWGKGYPFLLTTCYGIDYRTLNITTQPGPFNPTLNSTYQFMTNLFQEVSTVFPDDYIHIGGDEVSHECWESNPDILKWMRENNMTDFAEIEQFYITKIIQIVENLNKKSMVWQDVIDNGVMVFNQTVVEVWKNPWEVEVNKVTDMGLQTVLSSPWYLNYISYGSDWITYYGVDPTSFGGTPEQIALLKGGEACLWGEYIDDTNFIPTLWPRASAVAERLWSNETVDDVDDATIRINDMTCRLILRNINAQPVNGPGYCQHEWYPAYKPLN